MHEVSCGTVGLDKEENLTYECHPSRSDEWVEGDQREITDEIRNGNDKVYSE